MKKIFYIAFAAAALAAVSCSREPDLNVDPSAEPQGLVLRFTCSNVATRATVDGVGNEDLIKQIDYFFFPLNAEGKVGDDTEYVYHGTFVPTDDGLAGTYVETIQPGVLSQIFPNNATEAVVFAVANYVDEFGSNPSMEDVNTSLPEDVTTWKGLHDLKVGASFFKDGGPGFQLRWPRAMKTDDENLFFVMAADSVGVQLNTSGSYAIDAEIPLERLASKVTVTFEYESFLEEKESGNIMWLPQPSGEETRVYLSNAIEHTTLGGPLTGDLVADSWGAATKPLGNGTRDIFEYGYDFMNDIPAGQVPYYYTYPFSSEEGDDNQPYLKLVLPWYGYKGYVDEENPGVLYKQKEVYYKIVLPRETITEPNRIYEYSVKVNIIGSDKEVKIIGEEYVVKDWLSKEPISSNVATGRYISLDIPKDEYDMYVDLIDIAFVSSGTVIAKVDEIYQWNFSSATPTKDYFMQNGNVVASSTLMSNKGVTADDIRGWVTIPTETSYLEINHEMDNQMKLANNTKNPGFDMAPYVFKVTLHLEEAGDDTTFDRTVIITQYPALYVTNKVSNGYAFINSYSNNRGGGNVCYDDRGQGTNYQLGNFANAPGTLDGSGDNSNPNNYIISTSILPDDSYVIGDPRSQTVNNLTNLGGLSNYHPTEPEGTSSIIAPKFLVASSYGVVSGSYFFNQATAVKRCASYQENGYPAGRWRVPTFSEIKFMMELSNLGFIPSLFNLGANDAEGYWCANGKVSGDSNALPYLSNDTQNTAVRCVYDAWYWGEEPFQENATTWLGFQD